MYIYIFFYFFIYSFLLLCVWHAFCIIARFTFSPWLLAFRSLFCCISFQPGIKERQKKVTQKKKQQENSDTHTRAKSHPHIRTHTHARTRTHTHTLKNAHAAEKKYEQFFFIFLVIFCVQISWCVKFIIYVYFQSGFRFLLHYSWDFVQDGACKTLRKIYDFLSEELALFSVSIVCD